MNFQEAAEIGIFSWVHKNSLNEAVQHKFVIRMSAFTDAFEEVNVSIEMALTFTLGLCELKLSGDRTATACYLDFKLPDCSELGWFLVLNTDNKITDIVLRDPDLPEFASITIQ